MRCDLGFRGARIALWSCLLAIGTFSSALAGSIQQPGLTTGLAEGYGLTEGLYSVTAINFGYRNSNPDTKSGTLIPVFATWATPVEIADARLLIKAAPLVYVSIDSGDFHKSSAYNPYLGAWLSWYLGNGLNLAIGEGAQIRTHSDIDKLTGRDFTAFQQNVALSYVKDNWNITGNAFYTAGRTEVRASQPRTMNIDFTAIKRDGRMEMGLIAFGQWDLNRPAIGYGEKQQEIAVGGLFSYLVGNQVSVQFKLTTDIYQRNLGGRETRAWVQFIVPLYTPPAPEPRNAGRSN